jgi:hypothetical protein
MPGPTLRDVRLAMLIEGMFRDTYKPRDKELNLMLPQEQRPVSLDEIYALRLEVSGNNQNMLHE